jgi:hypothetical protein
VLLVNEERALRYVRDRESALPPFRYGADYERSDAPALEADDLVRSTERWACGERVHPSVELSVRAHDLLFDLLETGGGELFPVT